MKQVDALSQLLSNSALEKAITSPRKWIRIGSEWNILALNLCRQY